MRHLDLFSGIGGFALAASWAWQEEHELVSFCEIDHFCQHVLQKHWPDVPIVSDIRELKGDNIGKIDLLTGGFPCQPFSRIGKQEGESDNRYLWPEMLRVIAETQPRWVIGENVAGILDLVFEQVLFDLESQGYEAWAVVIPACAINAPHRRDRVWFMAHPQSEERSQQKTRNGREMFTGRGEESRWCQQWKSQPSVCRVVDGIPGQMDRLRSLGNAIVPQVAAVIMSAIKEVDRVYNNRMNPTPNSGRENWLCN